MAYSPNFSRNSKGKFNPELGLVSIKGGTDAYLLEDELNEIQWIQNEARAELIRKLTNSGCMQAEQFGEYFKTGGLKELLHNNLNSFLLCGFDAILNGYLAYIDRSDLDGNIITLPNPPATGLRNDFVYLEFWFNELKQYENVKRYGGINNQSINYDIIDSRLGVETSRRVQLQWNIRAIPDVNPNDYPLGFTTEFGISNPTINPICNTNQLQTDYTFRNHSNDKNLYITGNGNDSDMNTLKTVDGFCYAIPLFFVKRLNNGGYDEINNPYGSINYVDINSISTRPDGKFSNIIYQDDVIDVRPLAIMGRSQLDSIYASKIEFENYKTVVNNTNTNVLNEINDTKNDIALLQYQVGDLITTQVDNMGPRMDSAEARISNLQLEFSNISFNVNNILTKVNDIDQRLMIVEAQLTKLGIDLSFTILLYYGTNMVFYDILSMGGQAQTDGTLNCTGAIVNSVYTGHANYGIMYTADSLPSGKLGDIWLEKADSAALFKNSGYGGVKVNTIVLENNSNNGVIVGSGTFNGMTGVTILRPLAATDFLFITPTSNIYGTIGEIYYEVNETGFTVYNTGHANTTFDYIIIDTTQLRNVVLTDISYNGITTITDVFGTDFKAFIGPCNIPSNQGSIGDVTTTKSLNTLTIYNTGSSSDGSATAKCLIFKEIVIEEQ